MPEKIRIGIIGGSGLGEAIFGSFGGEELEEVMVDTPFGPPSGPVRLGRYEGVELALLQRHGDGHVLNPGAIPYRANIFAMKKLGVTHVVASGATGSLREEIEPGDLVICDQLIDKTENRPRTFFEHAAVHVEFADPFCPVMRCWLTDAAQSLDDVTVHDRGTYVCMEGPSFSTVAESHMHRQWGGDLVGMTALPEARLAREAELAYALIALPTDYDCWRPKPEGTTTASLLEEIMGNLQRAIDESLQLLISAFGDTQVLQDRISPAHDSLRLAIWSNKAKIEPSEIERLRPIWNRYFES